MGLMSPRSNKGYCISKNNGKVIKSELWRDANNKYSCRSWKIFDFYSEIGND